VVNMVYKSF